MPPLSPPRTTAKASSTNEPATGSLAALAPLKGPVFRLLWSTWVIANICMWMNDVAAAWLMTSLTVAPIWVALVHTASTLPVFVLGLPGGALADMLDRRRYLIFTQFWVAVMALALCVAILSDVMSPWLLLVLTFGNGIGRAMRWPVYAAIVPELVPRAQLPAALALNGVAQNLSRIVGPLIAGALIASAGSIYVFVLNAVLSVISAFILMRWRSERVVRTREREPLLSAMRVGVQFVRQSPHMKNVLLRVSLFFFHSTALLALLPLVARDLGGGAGTYTLLLAFMGGGAIVTSTHAPVLVARYPCDVRHRSSGRSDSGRRVFTRSLCRPSRHVFVRYGLNLGGELACRLGTTRITELGTGSGNGHVPDGPDGRDCARRRVVGADGDHQHRANQSGRRRRE
jgi:MFS family permease